jgi:hypothetical protein
MRRNERPLGVVNYWGISNLFGHPNDNLSPRLLTAVLSDGARVVRRQSPDSSGDHEHKPFPITVPNPMSSAQKRFAYLANTLSMRRWELGGRVEEGRLTGASQAANGFPSPLIKLDASISNIQLSDWFHRSTHASDPHHMVPCDGTEDFSLRPATQRDRKVISVTRCYRLIVNHRSVSSFTSTPEARALPSAGITRPQRSYGPLRLPGWPSSFDDVEGATFAIPGSPPITQTTFPACRAHYPGGPYRCLSVSSLSARPSPVNRRVGIHDFTSSRPAQASLALRPAGLLARPKADFCPEASTRPVTRPSRSVAITSHRQLHEWILLPLVICRIWIKHPPVNGPPRKSSLTLLTVMQTAGSANEYAGCLLRTTCARDRELSQDFPPRRDVHNRADLLVNWRG